MTAFLELLSINLSINGQRNSNIENTEEFEVRETLE
jgi:hypothetical protein